MLTVASHTVEGHVSRGFEAVALAFADNFARRHELGGACCAYVHGEKVVDLWGGVRNKETGEPWERDTIINVYSTTKTMAALCALVLADRVYALARGSIVLEAAGNEHDLPSRLERAYFGQDIASTAPPGAASAP